MNKIEKYLASKTWPFLAAEGILKKIDNKIPSKGFVLFETGYGPSGLPHIGTFGEVLRTTIVRKAFERLSDIPTKLICFSDDMDGMRKIPDTIPNKELYIKYMDLPLSRIPDPFKTHLSFGDNMNSRLIKFLDHFEFNYEFRSATKCYNSGIFNAMLLHALERYDEIMDIMIPTLGEERRKTYSPFMPICKETGKVLQVQMLERDLNEGAIAYLDPISKKVVWTKVTNGECKLQWKPDFGMRWAALDVDFEMYGKEHLVNGPLYTRICNVLGNKGPFQIYYELFLDENGEKISKSKGNGITIDDWLRYAPKESLALLMYNSPQRAKKLCLEVIPRYVDDYLKHISAFFKEDEEKQISNPVFYIHNGNPPQINTEISYSMLLSLVNACNTDDINVVWGYIKLKYPNADKCNFVKHMVSGVINYYVDFIKSQKQYRNPTEREKEAFAELIQKFSILSNETTSEIVQNITYDIGKKHNIELKSWFQGLYEVLLGTPNGPRFGSFVALYGIDKTIELLKSKI